MADYPVANRPLSCVWINDLSRAYFTMYRKFFGTPVEKLLEPFGVSNPDEMNNYGKFDEVNSAGESVGHAYSKGIFIQDPVTKLPERYMLTFSSFNCSTSDDQRFVMKLYKGNLNSEPIGIVDYNWRIVLGDKNLIDSAMLAFCWEDAPRY